MLQMCIFYGVLSGSMRKCTIQFNSIQYSFVCENMLDKPSNWHSRNLGYKKFKKYLCL